jgi:hypothetical protein
LAITKLAIAKTELIFQTIKQENCRNFSSIWDICARNEQCETVGWGAIEATNEKEGMLARGVGRDNWKERRRSLCLFFNEMK